MKFSFKKVLIILIPSLILFILMVSASLNEIGTIDVKQKGVSKTIVFLYKDDCDECNEQREEINRFKLEESVNNVSFEEVKVDTPRYLDFTKIHRVDGIPSIIILAEDGTPLYEHNGLHTSEDIASALSSTVKTNEEKEVTTVDEEVQTEEVYFNDEEEELNVDDSE